MVLVRAAVTIMIGLSIGALLALAAGRGMRAMLHGVSPNDPRTFAVSMSVIGAVALLAAWIPAHRTTRTNPVSAMRGD